MSALFDTNGFDQQRQHMIDCQLLTNRIIDDRVIQAFKTIPREVFVPEISKKHAYTDVKISLNNDRFLLEPMVLGKLLQAAQPKADEVALIIGFNTGYSVALFSQLMSAVFAIEENVDFSKEAQKNLNQLDVTNVEIVKKKASEGFEKQKPYQVIFIEGAVEDIPKSLIDQLDEGGRLVTLFKEDDFTTKGRLYLKTNNIVSYKNLFETNFPVLDGFEKPSQFQF